MNITDKEDAGVFVADGDPDEKYSEMLKRRRRMQCSPTNADIIFAFATVNGEFSKLSLERQI